MLFARIGIPHSPKTGELICKHTPTQIVNKILKLPDQCKIYIMAPIKDDPQRYTAMGYNRFKINGNVLEAEDLNDLLPNAKYTYEKGNYTQNKYEVPNSIIVDRIITGKKNIQDRLASSVENALKLGDGYMYVEVTSPERELLRLSEKSVCLDTDYSFGAIEPRKFSFNAASSWCKSCHGIGSEELIDIANYINPDIAIQDALEKFFDECDIPYYFTVVIARLSASGKTLLKKNGKI